MMACLLTACGDGATDDPSGLNPRVREACHAVQLHPQAREIKRTEHVGVPGQMPEWQIAYQVNGAGPRDVYAFLSDALQRQGWTGIGFTDGETSLATVAERARLADGLTQYPSLAATRPGLAYVVGIETSQPGTPLTVRVRCQDRQLVDGVQLK
jgi:hypothetical protein